MEVFYGLYLLSNTLKHLQVLINKNLHKMWDLPPNSHTSIVLKTAGLSFLSNMIIKKLFLYAWKVITL